MLVGIQVPFISLIFIILLDIVYFTKNRLLLVENKYFSIILIVSTAEIFVNTIVQFASSYFPFDMITGELYQYFNYANKFLVICFVVIFLAVLGYVITISYEKYRDNQMKLLKPMGIFMIIFTIIIQFTNIKLAQYDHVVNVRGLTIDFSFLIVAIIMIIISVITVKNLKNNDRRYYFIFLMIILLSIVYGLILFIPSIIFYDLALAILCYVMYFSIENPDIALIKKLNDAVESANKANMAKSDFLSSMSHEIRTPLNVIVGLSEDMKNNDKFPADFKEDISDVVNASNTLLEIVGNVIDISKIESNKMETVDIKYSIVDLVESVIKLNETRIGGKDLKLTATFAKDLPYELYGDKFHLKQIISNLVSNAIKYTKRGFVKVHVKCINYKTDALLIISVEDTGMGIKKENISRLYQKFDRLDVERNTTVEGVGLGLAITKKLVNLLGGKINVQSSVGHGSLFVVSVKQKISLMNKIIRNEDLYCVVNRNNFLKDKKALVVDDNNLNIKVAKRFLEQLGIICDVCYSGEKSIEKVRENTYDVILMDIMMPGISGEDAYKELCKLENFNTPVIALTADAIAGAKEKYIKLGFKDYISKPFSKEHIEKVITEVISR